MYDREAPTRGFAACLTKDGRRTWGNTMDPELMREMQTREFCGSEVRLENDGQMVLV